MITLQIRETSRIPVQDTDPRKVTHSCRHRIFAQSRTNSSKPRILTESHIPVEDKDMFTDTHSQNRAESKRSCHNQIHAFHAMVMKITD